MWWWRLGLNNLSSDDGYKQGGWLRPLWRHTGETWICFQYATFHFRLANVNLRPKLYIIRSNILDNNLRIFPASTFLRKKILNFQLAMMDPLMGKSMDLDELSLNGITSVSIISPCHHTLSPVKWEAFLQDFCLCKFSQHRTWRYLGYKNRVIEKKQSNRTKQK